MHKLASPTLQAPPRADFDTRVSRVSIVLDRLCAKNPTPPDAIPVKMAIPSMARELAMIWDAPANPIDKKIVSAVRKFKDLAENLVRHQGANQALSGISSEMILAIIRAATADIFSRPHAPKRARPEKLWARQLAAQFAVFYPILKGSEPGSNLDNDFVVTLGELFVALDFNANAQHYARSAIKGSIKVTK